eukprot:701853-Rhodomonas_salina.3
MCHPFLERSDRPVPSTIRPPDLSHIFGVQTRKTEGADHLPPVLLLRKADQAASITGDVPHTPHECPPPTTETLSLYLFGLCPRALATNATGYFRNFSETEHCMRGLHQYGKLWYCDTDRLYETFGSDGTMTSSVGIAREVIRQSGREIQEVWY